MTGSLTNFRLVRRLAGSSNLAAVDGIKHRVLHPLVNGRLAPAGAARRDAHLPGEGAALDLAVEGRTREAGAVEDRVEAKDAVG